MNGRPGKKCQYSLRFDCDWEGEIDEEIREFTIEERFKCYCERAIRKRDESDS